MITERQELQYLSKLFPFQKGIPGSNKTRRLRRKRIKFMRGWLNATAAGRGFQLYLPRLEGKMLMCPEITSHNLREAFAVLRSCYDATEQVQYITRPLNVPGIYLKETS